MSAETAVAAVPLYVSNGGNVSCGKCGGSYLRRATQERPNGKRFVTPLDVWERVSKADVEDAERIGESDLWRCDGCKAPALVTR